MAKINFKKIQDRLGGAAGLVAGSVAGGYIKTTIEKMGAGKITPAVGAGLRLGLAAALPSLMGGKKAGFVEDFSNGLMAEAGISLAKALNVPGISGTDIDEPIGGYNAWNGMGGTDIDSPVAGTEM